MRATLAVVGALQVMAAVVAAMPASPTTDEPRPIGETVVQGQREGAPRARTDDLHDGPDALLSIPGLALARDGGPLSPSRPLLRGLGGARLGVDVAGVDFIDLVSGDVDVALLPLALGVATVDLAGGRGLGGQLSLRPSPGDRVQLVVGELATLQGSARLTLPVASGRVTGAVHAGSTRGDFPFLVVDADGTPAAALVRSNNDQRRIDSVVVAELGGPMPEDDAGAAGRLHARVVAVGALHEGGIPGFATAPLSLRGERARGAVGAVVGWRQRHHHVDVAVDALGDRRRVGEAGRVDEVTAGGRGAGVVVGTRFIEGEAGAVSGAVSGRGGAVVLPGLAVRRELRGQVAVDARAPLGPDATLGLAVSGGGVVVDDRDVGVIVDDAVPSDGTHWLPSGRLELSAARAAGRLALAARHAARAPTLDERFAPAGFIQGNPQLRPERVTDVELRGGLAVDDDLVLEVATFGSRLEDAIVLVNKNAFEVVPDNTGPALRAGVELSLLARPLPLVALEQAATLLWSEVEATGAPLPTAPPLSLRSRARLGTDDAWVSTTVTGRGSAPSTIFGTLGSGAFVLVDLAARLPLAEQVALTLAVDNAFDVRSARDQNLLPLPGRLASVGLEVRP